MSIRIQVTQESKITTLYVQDFQYHVVINFNQETQYAHKYLCICLAY